MLFYLLLLFTILPIVELSILVWIGRETEWFVPVLLVLLTGVAGAAIARWQGWQALQRIRTQARAGRIPTGALVDGFLILIAGILLVTPGVISDLVGLALLVPPVRALFKRYGMVWIMKGVQVRVWRATTGAGGTATSAARHRSDEIVDARVVNTRIEDAE